MKKLIYCRTCSTILTLDIRNESTPILLERKNRGNLIKPSDDIVEICQVAERVFRGTNVLYTKTENQLQYLIVATIRLLRINLFTCLDDHIKEQELLNDHKYELIKGRLKARWRPFTESRELQIRKPIILAKIERESY